MKRAERFKFHVMLKESRSKDIEYYDVMPTLYNTIYTSNGKISKKSFCIYDEKTYKRKEITTKEDLKKFINSHFRYHYWAKCEWEFIVEDWPIHFNSRSVKVDAYSQLKPNINLITDLLWNELKDKITKK